MEPFALTTERLVLDQPGESDVDRIAEFCTDPVFERFLTTPWPYLRSDAVFFVERFVPRGWASGEEWTWAIREDGALLGVVGVRTGAGSLGFWLGAPHRGRGVMPEAVTAVIDAVFARRALPVLHWECVPGNLPSAAVARRTGFRFTGTGAAESPARDGTGTQAWTGALARDEDRAPKPWPVLAAGA